MKTAWRCRNSYWKLWKAFLGTRFWSWSLFSILLLMLGRDPEDENSISPTRNHSKSLQEYLFWTLRLCFPNPPHPLNLKDLYRWWFESKCSGGKMRPVGRTWSEVAADKRFRRPWWSRSGYLCCFPLNLSRVREIFTFDLIDIYSQ